MSGLAGFTTALCADFSAAYAAQGGPLFGFNRMTRGRALHSSPLHLNVTYHSSAFAPLSKHVITQVIPT